MERSTKILLALLLIAGAITIVAVAAPGAVQNFAEGTVIAPVVSAFVGLVVAVDAQRASYMLAGGLIGGLFLALAIKRIDVPKRVRMIRGKPLMPVPVYQGGPNYTPPQQITPTPVQAPAPVPVAQPVATPEETTTQ